MAESSPLAVRRPLIGRLGDVQPRLGSQPKGSTDKAMLGGSARLHRSFESLPIEIVERTLRFLPWTEVVRLARTSRQLYALCSSPSLFRFLDLGELENWRSAPVFIRARATTLVLREAGGASTGTLSSYIAESDCGNLTSLDLSFCAHANELLFDALPVKTRWQLKHLKLRGCKQVRDGIWLAELLPFLETLDLSWSGIRVLPGGELKAEPVLHGAVMDMDEEEELSLASDDTLVDEQALEATTPWQRLRRLHLAGCGYLERDSLTDFVSEALPPALVFLDLQWHTPLSLDIDALSVALPTATGPDRIFDLDMARCDAVTLAHVAHMMRRTQIRVTHTAVLEAESIAAYRQYIDLLSSSF